MPIKKSIVYSLIILLAVISPSSGLYSADLKSILVLSAASTTESLKEIADKFSDEEKIKVNISISSSGILANQILKGVPADIFISASKEWIDFLIENKRLDEKLTKPIIGNELALVSKRGTFRNIKKNIFEANNFIQILNNNRLVLGGPAHVPAGRYAKISLENLGLWSLVKDRVIKQVNVRAALTMIERGEINLGIVYKTDIKLSKGIEIIEIFPKKQSPEIVYYASILKNKKNEKNIKFFNALTESNSLIIFKKNGFNQLHSIE